MNDRYPAAGMSLIELVIVMGLLAAMATVAISTLDGLGDRDRVDTTQHRLDMIRHAIVGDGMEYGRFLSDMGRPLAAHYRTDAGGDPLPGAFLCELWDDSLYAPQSTPLTISYNGSWDALSGTLATLDAPVFYGWDGPYLDVAGGELYDGFGNEFYLKDNAAGTWDDAAFVTAGASIRHVFNIKSCGADGQDDGSVNPADWTDEDAELYPADAVPNPNCSLHVAIRIRDYRTGAWISPDDQAIGASYIGERNTTNDSTLFSPGEYVQYGGLLYRCWKVPDTESKGETGSFGNLDEIFRVDQTDPSSPLRDIVVDNEVVWAKSSLLNAVRVVVLAPFASLTTGNVNVRQITFWKGNSSGGFDGSASGLDDTESEGDFTASDASWNGVGELEIEKLDSSDFGLTPGLRKILVYGYYDMANSSDYPNAYSSSGQTLKLHPGNNYLTVYLEGRG